MPEYCALSSSHSSSHIDLACRLNHVATQSRPEPGENSKAGSSCDVLAVDGGLSSLSRRDARSAGIAALPPSWEILPQGNDSKLEASYVNFRSAHPGTILIFEFPLCGAFAQKLSCLSHMQPSVPSEDTSHQQSRFSIAHHCSKSTPPTSLSECSEDVRIAPNAHGPFLPSEATTGSSPCGVGGRYLGWLRPLAMIPFKVFPPP